MAILCINPLLNPESQGAAEFSVASQTKKGCRLAAFFRKGKKDEKTNRWLVMTLKCKVLATTYYISLFFYNSLKI